MNPNRCADQRRRSRQAALSNSIGGGAAEEELTPPPLPIPTAAAWPWWSGVWSMLYITVYRRMVKDLHKDT